MSGFPWKEVMAFGLGVLRLSPQSFWAMTPREIAAAHEGISGRGGAPLDRGALDALMVRHPDEEEK